jgi:hypothetical protein
MKWTTHKMVTGTIVYTLTGGNVAYTVAAMAGSIVPDLLEGMPKSEDQEESLHWRKRHRRLTHWFVPYALLSLISFFITRKVLHVPPVDLAALTEVAAGTTYSPLFPLFGFVFLGGLFHIPEDAICGKVPSLNPQK